MKGGMEGSCMVREGECYEEERFLEVFGLLLFIIKSNTGLCISAKVSFIWSFFLLR
jgi:hypothetical protein